MRNVLTLAAAVGLLAGLAGRAAADEAAQAVIDKAVKAHGGIDNLKKFKDTAVHVKAKANINQGGGIEANMEVFAGDKKFKQVLQFNINGMDITQVTCYDGKELWVAINGKVAMTIKDEKELAAVKEEAQADELAGLVLLKDKGVELSVIGDDKVDGKAVVGVRVSRKDRKDVSMYFDKETGLLVKTKSRMTDFLTKQEVEQEKILSDHKEDNGIKRAGKVLINRDGNKLLEAEILEVKFLDKLADDTFNKPSD